jgi:hypothetical protein
MRRLRALGIDVHIWPMPVEVADPIRFDQDRIHAAYDPVQVNRFWRALAQIDQVFAAFRGRFIGKVSPGHFFWGSFDLAVTRFGGRAPRRQQPNIPDAINREAYSHEVSSAGFGRAMAALAGCVYSMPIRSRLALPMQGQPGDAYYSKNRRIHPAL